MKCVYLRVPCLTVKMLPCWQTGSTPRPTTSCVARVAPVAPVATGACNVFGVNNAMQQLLDYSPVDHGEYAPAYNKETAAQAEERRGAKRFTLQEARGERTRCRDLVRQGINPADHRKQEQIKAEHAARITFEVIAKEWLSMRDWHELTKLRRLDVFERVIFPKIGQLPIAQITSLQVLDVLNDADKKNGPSVRDVAKRSMSSVFELAIATLRAETDPVYPVRKAHPRNKTQHKRALEEGEIAQLLRDFKGLGGRYETV